MTGGVGDNDRTSVVVPDSARESDALAVPRTMGDGGDRVAVKSRIAGHLRGWRRPANFRQRVPWLVFALALIGEAAVQIVQDRRLWFFRDDFAFLLAQHISKHPVDTLLAPHNEHWSTLPLIAFRVMWHVFGLSHYLPYAVMPLLLHLVLSVCLAVLAHRAESGAWAAVLAGVVFAYLGGGAGAENTLWAFQIGFIGSCLAGFLAVLCFDLAIAGDPERVTKKWFWIGELALVAALMCSGMGVPMVIAVAAWTALRRGPMAAARSIAIPFVVYICWYVGWGHTGFKSEPSLTAGLENGPRAAANGIGNVWSVATAMPAAGPAVLIALLAAVVVNRRYQLRVLAAAGLVGLVAEYLLVGFGRSKVSLEYVLHSRYLYLGVALCTPAVASAFDLIARRLRDVRFANIGAWLAVAVLVVVLGASETAEFAAYRRSIDPDRKQELIAAVALIRQGIPMLSDRIDPFDVSSPHPAMSVSLLKQAHALGEVPAGRSGPAALFGERSVLQVTIQPTPARVPAASTYRWADHWTPGASGSPVLTGCTTRRTTRGARLAIPLGSHGAQVRVRFEPRERTGALVKTRVVRNGEASVGAKWPINARWGLTGPFHVAGIVPHAVLQVVFPAGQVEVCPAG